MYIILYKILFVLFLYNNFKIVLNDWHYHISSFRDHDLRVLFLLSGDFAYDMDTVRLLFCIFISI